MYDREVITKALDRLDKDPASAPACAEILGGQLGILAKKNGTPETEVVNRFQSSFHSGYVDPNWRPGGDTATTSR